MNQKLWTKPYILNLIAISVASITMTIMMPLLPIYIKMIGGDVSLAGIVVSVFTLAALIFRPITAHYIDRYGRKPALIIGMALIIIGCFLYQFVTLIGLLILIRVIHGIGYSSGTNATGTIVADVVPRERRGQGIGYYGFVTAASLALGPATGLMIMNHLDIKTAFFVAGCLAIVGLIVAILIDYDVTPLKNETPERKKKFQLGYEKTSLPATGVMILVAFAYSGIMTFLAVYASTLEIHNTSTFFLVYAVVLLITRLIVDQITKSREIFIVLLPGIGLMAVAFLILATSTSMSFFLIAAVFFAVGYGSVQPTLNAIVVSLCAPHKRGAANSTFFSGLDLGIGAGAFIWGLVSKAFGYPAIYFGCIVFMAFAAVAVFVLLKRSKESLSLK